MTRRGSSIGTSVLLAFALASSGCDEDGSGVPGGTDSGSVDVDAGTAGDTDAGASCSEPPPAPYGTFSGFKLEPFELPQCDGTPYAFYNEAYCEARFTVLSIAAGWCPPCIRESSEMTERITEPYRPQGVRVIQILVQDADYRAPTQEFCQSWVDTYGLTNVEVMDATGITAPFFPDNSLPATIIVDSEGTIVFRENGATEGLLSLRAKLDELLAADGT